MRRSNKSIIVHIYRVNLTAGQNNFIAVVALNRVNLAGYGSDGNLVICDIQITRFALDIVPVCFSRYLRKGPAYKIILVFGL